MSVSEMLKRLGARLLGPKPEPKLMTRFTPMDPERCAALEKSLRTQFFAREDAGYLDTDAGAADLADHMTGRLDHDRRWYIPWLNAALPLDGARVLEIGCGTGVSTLALAEQGARVTAVDVDAPAVDVARRRLELFDLDAEVLTLSAVEIERAFGGRSFDLIVYWASLEHMTIEERLATLAQSWRLLAPGQMCAVVEAPNRLHFLDFHTSCLPFFHWLPDDLAMDYARFSPRPGFQAAMAGRDTQAAGSREVLARWGRGLSYHEFELAMAPLPELDIVNSMVGHHSATNPLYGARYRMSANGRWARMLKRIKPAIPDAFLEPGLSLVIRRT
jgi:S-adenosylmethionine-dependent methyltransferase